MGQALVRGLKPSIKDCAQISSIRYVPSLSSVISFTIAPSPTNLYNLIQAPIYIISEAIYNINPRKPFTPIFRLRKAIPTTKCAVFTKLRWAKNAPPKHRGEPRRKQLRKQLVNNAICISEVACSPTTNNADVRGAPSSKAT